MRMSSRLIPLGALLLCSAASAHPQGYHQHVRVVVHAERVEYAMDALTLHRVQASYGTMTLVVRGTPWRDRATVTHAPLVITDIQGVAGTWCPR